MGLKIGKICSKFKPTAQLGNKKNNLTKILRKQRQRSFQYHTMFQYPNKGTIRQSQISSWAGEQPVTSLP